MHEPPRLAGSCPTRLPTRCALRRSRGHRPISAPGLAQLCSCIPFSFLHPCLPRPAVYLTLWFSVQGYCYMGGCSLAAWGLDDSGIDWSASDVESMMGEDSYTSNGNAFDLWGWGLWTSEMKVGVTGWHLVSFARRRSQ